MAAKSTMMMPSLVLLMALVLSCSGISRAARLLEEEAPKEEYPYPATPAELPKPELPPHPTDVVPPEVPKPELPPHPAVPELPKPEVPEHPTVPELPHPDVPEAPKHELPPALPEPELPPKAETHYPEPETKP